mgnify:CR=1 FL=1
METPALAYKQGVGGSIPPSPTTIHSLHLERDRTYFHRETVSRRRSLPAHRDRGPFYPYVRAGVDAVDPTNARVSLGESSGAGIESGGACRLRPQIRG